MSGYEEKAKRFNSITNEANSTAKEYGLPSPLHKEISFLLATTLKPLIEENLVPDDFARELVLIAKFTGPESEVWQNVERNAARSILGSLAKVLADSGHSIARRPFYELYLTRAKNENGQKEANELSLEIEETLKGFAETMLNYANAFDFNQALKEAENLLKKVEEYLQQGQELREKYKKEIEASEKKHYQEADNNEKEAAKANNRTAKYIYDGDFDGLRLAEKGFIELKNTVEEVVTTLRTFSIVQAEKEATQ